MFRRIAGAALVLGAALTVLPAGAFAQEWGGDRYAAHAYRAGIRHEERVDRWRAHEFREHAWRVQERRVHERRAYRYGYGR